MLVNLVNLHRIEACEILFIMIIYHSQKPPGLDNALFMLWRAVDVDSPGAKMVVILG